MSRDATTSAPAPFRVCLAAAAACLDPALPTHERVRATLAAIRAARFPTRPRCPRCTCPRTQPWGHFGARRRYRCRRCRRTFSDLTGTAFAYGKRPELWLPYLACLLESLSVRACARRLGIHKDTAWRWRHRALAAHLARPAPPLRGTAELVTRRLGACAKGSRTLERPPLRRATPCYRTRRPSVCLLFLRDARGTTRALPAGPIPLYGADLERALAPHVTHLQGLRAPRGHGYVLPGFARFHHLAFEAVPLLQLRDQGPPGPLLRHALGDALRWRAWMRRFHGVATPYLARYLHWHELLQRLPDARLLLLLAIGSAPPGPHRLRPAT